MRPHRTDALSLTFGLIFLGVVFWWVLGRRLELPLPRVGWFVAGALIVLGVVGLARALRSDRRPSQQNESDPYEEM
jgi:hypothetical protein